MSFAGSLSARLRVEEDVMDPVERLFWSLAIFIGIILLWLGLIETLLPIEVGGVVAAVAGLWFFFFGFRLFDEKEDAA